MSQSLFVTTLILMGILITIVSPVTHSAILGNTKTNNKSLIEGSASLVGALYLIIGLSVIIYCSFDIGTKLKYGPKIPGKSKVENKITLTALLILGLYYLVTGSLVISSGVNIQTFS